MEAAFMPLLGDKQCFWGAVLSQPGTLSEVGLDFMGLQYRWMPTKGAAAAGEGHRTEQNRTGLLLSCVFVL